MVGAGRPSVKLKKNYGARDGGDGITIIITTALYRCSIIYGVDSGNGKFRNNSRRSGETKLNVFPCFVKLRRGQFLYVYYIRTIRDAV